MPGALLLAPLSPPFAAAAELLPAIAVTANDAAALVRELLPPEQAELALRSPLLQANLAPFCDQTQRQLELLQLARPAKRLCRAVVVGLDGVGKTSILTALRTGRVASNSLLQTPAEDVASTQGCNKSALYRNDVSGRWTPESGDHASFGLELLDVGGGSGERQHWPQLAVRSTAILAVVDGRETGTPHRAPTSTPDWQTPGRSATATHTCEPHLGQTRRGGRRSRRRWRSCAVAPSCPRHRWCCW